MAEWWPMAHPPLPNREADKANGWPWVEKSRNGIVAFIRTEPPVTAEMLAVELPPRTTKPPLP